MKGIFLIILILIIILYKYCNISENFTDEEIKQKSKEIYEKRHIFKPGVNYNTVKSNFNWMDTVLYNDIYNLSLKEKLTTKNLEDAIYNGML